VMETIFPLIFDLSSTSNDIFCIYTVINFYTFNIFDYRLFTEALLPVMNIGDIKHNNCGSSMDFSCLSNTFFTVLRI
jgi:hypothetical protein